MTQDQVRSLGGRGCQSRDTTVGHLDLLQDMFEALGQILWFLRPDGLVERFNTAWTVFTGLPAVMEGLSWADVFHPEDRRRLVKARTAGVASGKPYEVEARMRRADSVYRRHLCRVKPLQRDDTIYAWVGTAIDIEDVRAAEERQRALVELEIACVTSPTRRRSPGPVLPLPGRHLG